MGSGADSHICYACANATIPIEEYEAQEGYICRRCYGKLGKITRLEIPYRYIGYCKVCWKVIEENWKKGLETLLR